MALSRPTRRALVWLGADQVGDSRGELHETRGVWIGDGSALPSAPGTNPMVSIMAIAHRTAEAMLEMPRP